jgi:hypothetical protein
VTAAWVLIGVALCFTALGRSHAAAAVPARLVAILAALMAVAAAIGSLGH